MTVLDDQITALRFPLTEYYERVKKKGGITKAKTETLLRRLAQTATKDSIRLRACELLLLIEGKLKQGQMSESGTVSDLAELIAANPAENAGKAESERE